ncbi:uncharacterized protein [Amphiura filiformis]|uniref:uncharacterized protein n=1 Tax=Amphiura filiformis TaxID=82378 RepID=UPI003B225DC7
MKMSKIHGRPAFLKKIPALFGELRKKMRKISMKEAKKRIDDSLQYFNGIDDFCTEEAYNAIICIEDLPRELSGIPTGSTLPHDEYQAICRPSTRQVAEYLTQKRFAELFVKIVMSLRWNLQSEDNPLAIEVLCVSLYTFCNLSDECPLLCQEFGKSKGPDCLLQLMSTLDNLGKDTDENDVFLCSTAVLLNGIRLCPENRKGYRKANAVEVLSNLKKRDSSDVLKLLLLSYIVDEEEGEKLEKSEGCVSMLTKLLTEAVDSKTHTATHIAGEKSVASSASELLDGLNHLAINDANKAEIAKHGGLKAIIRMLQSDFSEEEHIVATQALWILSFLDSIKRTSEVQASLPTLRSLTTSENQPIREASSYAVWEIQDNQRTAQHPNYEDPPPSYQESVKAQAQSGLSGHVMISYQWDSQDRVVTIRDNLVQAGYKVWMDVHNIRGDIIDAMADAVEKSDVILMCMTERYKDSTNCRSEAKYASKKKKDVIPLLLENDYDPDGWLGFMLGTKLYYKFCSDDEMTRNMEGLLRELGNRGRATATPSATAEAVAVGEDDVDGPVSAHTEPMVAMAPLTVGKETIRRSSTGKASTWSAEEVQSWLQDIGLSALSSSLGFQCDGDHLKVMYEQYKRSPDVFQNEMKTDLQLNYGDRLKLTAGLKRLFESE